MIQELGSLDEAFSSATIYDGQYDAQFRASAAPDSWIDYTFEDAGRYDQDNRFRAVYNLDLPTAFELSWSLDDMVVAQSHGSNRYLSESEQQTLEDTADDSSTSWTRRPGAPRGLSRQSRIYFVKKHPKDHLVRTETERGMKSVDLAPHDLHANLLFGADGSPPLDRAGQHKNGRRGVTDRRARRPGRALARDHSPALYKGIPHTSTAQPQLSTDQQQQRRVPPPVCSDRGRGGVGSVPRRDNDARAFGPPKHTAVDPRETLETHAHCARIIWVGDK